MGYGIPDFINLSLKLKKKMKTLVFERGKDLERRNRVSSKTRGSGRGGRYKK